MRVWEFQDKKETPSDLVREQDFILRVRSMQRSGAPFLVLNFILAAIEPLRNDEAAREAVHAKFREYAATTRGAYFEMSNGDVFLVWENPGEARLMANRAIDAALDSYRNNTNLYLLTFRMPENYTLLRERTNEYVNEVRERAAVSAPASDGPEKVDESSGRLTAKNVDQIEQLLADLDVRKFGRSQNIYKDDKGVWKPVAEEYFMSFQDLRRAYFPKLDIASSEHFFFALCSILDQKLLGALTESYETVAGRTININISIATIMGALFAQFVRAVPREKRNLIGFELHAGDMFQNFGATLSAMEVLKREGFRIAIDGVTPNIAAYVDLAKFPVDRVKVSVSKDHVSQLADAGTIKGMAQLLPEKLIFFHCDNQGALTAGRQMGVTLFQGWLIDDLAAKKA
jgi:hypothetical protein